MLNSFGRQQGGFHIKREEKYMGAINYGTNSILCSLGYYNTTPDTSEEAIKEYREEFDLSEEDYSDSEIAEKIYEDELLKRVKSREKMIRDICTLTQIL